MLRRFRRGLWEQPDFTRLWAGVTVSQFGTFVGSLALQFTAVLWLDASAIDVAVLSGAQMAPGFVAGPLTGVWVDRLRRRPILIAADLGRAAVLASVPVAAAVQLLTMQQLWAAAAVLSALSVLFDAAYRSYLPALVGRERLIEGNSMLAASQSVAEIGGFGLSGFLVQVLTAPGALLIDAASFAWSALWISRIRTPEARPDPVERTSAWREFRDGLAFVWAEPVLRSLGAATFILNTGGRIVGVLFLLYLAEEVGFDPGLLGVIFAVGGLTSIAGAVLANRTWFGGLGASLVVSVLIRAGGMAFMPLAGSVSLLSGSYLVANQLVTDPAWMYYEVNEITLRQSVTPDRLQGRMNATMRGLELAGMIAGTVLAGVLGEYWGLREALFLAVGITASAALVLAASPVGRLGAAQSAQSR